MMATYSMMGAIMQYVVVSSQATDRRQVSPCHYDGVAKRPVPRADRPGSLDKVFCLLALCIGINYLISPLLGSSLRKYIFFSSAGKENDEIKSDVALESPPPEIKAVSSTEVKAWGTQCVCQSTGHHAIRSTDQRKVGKEEGYPMCHVLKSHPVSCT